MNATAPTTTTAAPPIESATLPTVPTFNYDRKVKAYFDSTDTFQDNPYPSREAAQDNFLLNAHPATFAKYRAIATKYPALETRARSAALMVAGGSVTRTDEPLHGHHATRIVARVQSRTRAEMAHAVTACATSKTTRAPFLACSCEDAQNPTTPAARAARHCCAHIIAYFLATH